MRVRARKAQGLGVYAMQKKEKRSHSSLDLASAELADASKGKLPLREKRSLISGMARPWDVE